MLAWIQAHEILLLWLTGLMFVGSLIVVPWVVVCVPADYFVRRRRRVDRRRSRHPLLRVALSVLKNFFGGVLVLIGIAMLVGPGQGILTILVGLMFLDFPGKLALERRLVRQSPVIRAINWMRAKTNRPPLQMPKSPSLHGTG